MNKVFLVGRLVADPTPSVTSRGTQQSKITIAVNSNKMKDETYFFPCIAWANPANFINSFLKKGDLVAIDGELTRRSYISKQSNQTVYTTEIIVNTINSIGSRKQNNEFANAIENDQPKKSIDDAFKTNIVTSNEMSDQKTTSVPSTNDEIEWYDELNEGDK